MSECMKLVEGESAQAVAPKFYVVSINKLVYMSFLTTGLYLFYWFYRNWATYRDATGDRLIPILRTIIPVLFIYPLVNRVDKHLKQAGEQYDWSPKRLALGMWLIIVVTFAAGLLFPQVSGDLKQFAELHLYNSVRIVLQLVAIVWVVCKIQRAVNALECDPDGGSNSNFTGVNFVWMALGVFLWATYFFFIAVLFFDSH